jgi:hypothetical protein
MGINSHGAILPRAGPASGSEEQNQPPEERDEHAAEAGRRRRRPVVILPHFGYRPAYPSWVREGNHSIDGDVYVIDTTDLVILGSLVATEPKRTLSCNPLLFSDLRSTFERIYRF